jgi:putative two-component system response regulator
MPDSTVHLQKPLILVVDDAPQNLSLMDDLLSDDYHVKVAPSGVRALKIASALPQPDLILLDVMMPEMDGYAVCRQLKANAQTRDIPVIFLTAKAQIADEQQGFSVGAVDYITKPISPPIVLARVRTHLMLRAAATFLKDKNLYLESEIVKRTEETRLVEEATVLALTSLAETRDNETGNHIMRTQRYVRALAIALRDHPRFSSYLNEQSIVLLFKSAPMHDIGKVGIPDRILLKPGKLTTEEFEVMKSHTTLGFESIQRASERIGRPVAFLQLAGEIALSHQEKWDGSGYPQGLTGDAIPISARLMALADVYDALISRRIYKEPMSHERSVQIIVQGRGQHFDPDIVEAFIAIQDQCLGIAVEFSDSEEDLAILKQRHEAHISGS